MPTSKNYRAPRYFDTTSMFKEYLRFLTGQGVTLPSYGTRLQWSQFFSAYQGLVPRNLAAYYPSDPAAIILDSSGNVNLWSDMSGNSATNALVLNGVAGNYGSSPSSAALQITGDIDLRALIAKNSITGGNTGTILAKEQTASTRSYRLEIISTGFLSITLSADGSASPSATSSVIFPSGNFGVLWARATWRQSDGRVQFFTSSDNISWTQLGTDQSLVIASINANNSQVEIGSRAAGTANVMLGNIYRAQIRSNILDNGTGIVFDADFTSQPKLATTFTESSSNAATVTVNTTGDTGARICGERDLYQGTSTKRPVYTGPSAGTRLSMLFDGTDDYLKAASFSLSQPETVYLVGQQMTWTLNDYFFDGGTGAANSVALRQSATTPNIRLIGGANTTENGGLAVAIRAIITSIVNLTNSSTRINRGAIITGDVSSGNALNGFILAARGDAAAGFGNISVQEIAIYAESHNDAVQSRVINYLSSKFGISL